MADVEQTQEIIPFITCEISLCQYVCELVFGVNVFDFGLGVQVDSISNNQSRATLCVRGSYSARVPRSSFARVRRVLVTHMVEEGEDQENEKEDEREDGQQRVEGRIVENQATHNMSA